MEKSLQEMLAAMTGPWSNNACRGYVIQAMESCGFRPKEISQVLEALDEAFDLWDLEKAEACYENWHP